MALKRPNTRARKEVPPPAASPVKAVRKRNTTKSSPNSAPVSTKASKAAVAKAAKLHKAKTTAAGTGDSVSGQNENLNTMNLSANTGHSQGANTTTAATPPAKRGRPRKTVQTSPIAQPGQSPTATPRSATHVVLPPGAAPKPPKNAIEYNTVPRRRTEVGEIFVMGSGDFGELGLGSVYQLRKKPMPLRELNNQRIVDFCVGGMHAMALTENGEVYSWGVNDNKALGRTGPEDIPAKILGLEGISVARIAAGDSISIAISEDGRLYMWGSFRGGQGLLGFARDNHRTQAEAVLVSHLLNVKIVDVTIGTDHVLALTTTGEVYAWGNGEQSQLGRRLIPRRQEAGLVPEKTHLKHIVRIGCGAYHSFAINNEGVIYSWGLNNFRQCGLSADAGRDQLIVTSPTIIDNTPFGGSPIKQCIGGNHFSLFLTESGKVFAFGRSDEHQLGLPYTVDPNEPVSIDEGDEQSQKNKKPKTAIGNPTLIPTLQNVTNIGCGSTHSLAVMNGDGYAWGFGESFALGNADTEDLEEPEKIEGQKIEGYRVLKIDGGASFTIMLACPTGGDSSSSCAMDCSA